MAVAQPRTTCSSLFKQLEIPPVPCQYIDTFINELHINNQEIFQTNSPIHYINIRNEYHLHRPNANLSCLKKYILCWYKNFLQFTIQHDKMLDGKLI
jgi:hypothetical protein